MSHSVDHQSVLPRLLCASGYGVRRFSCTEAGIPSGRKLAASWVSCNSLVVAVEERRHHSGSVTLSGLRTCHLVRFRTVIATNSCPHLAFLTRFKMRFAAPSRSPSPPPARGRTTPRKSILKSPASSKKSPGFSNAFGLRNLSDSEDDNDIFMAHSDAESSSSDSFCYASESEVPPRPRYARVTPLRSC
jgi:hypothetical protein